MVQVGIPEAAGILGVSEDTIRRRLRRGELKGERIPRAQGFTWAVHLDEATYTPGDDHDSLGQEQIDAHQDTHRYAPRQDLDAPGDTYETPKDELIRFLHEQIQVKDEQIKMRDEQLGIALLEVAALRPLALSAPKKKASDPRSWWMKLFNIQLESQENTS